MTGQRAVAYSLLLSLATACVPAVNQSLAPQRGPRARIHASFTGGITHRNAEARFNVESDAYALVGHLGGDGYIRILYPTNAMERGAVRKGETYTTSDVYAIHDAIPSVYQARAPLYRHVTARMDSYDGAGNGYFFLIASRYPLYFNEISDGALFDVIEVPDYYTTHDPRLTVRALGDLVSRGSPYTLEFAGSFGTVDYSTFYDRRLDCMTLSMVDLGWFGGYFSPYYVIGNRGTRSTLSCAQYAGFGFRRPGWYASYEPSPRVAPTVPRTEPRGTIRPPWQRRVTPTRRTPRAASSAYLPDRINARRATPRGSVGRRAYTPSSTSVSRDNDRSSSGSRASSPTRVERPAERASERVQPRSESPRTESPRTETTRSPSGSSPERKRDP